MKHKFFVDTGLKVQGFTWLPAMAVRPNFLQSSSSCCSMVMSGTRIIVMEPVICMNGLGFQDFTSSTWRQEVTKQKHRKRFAKSSRQSTEDVVWIILIQGISQYVQLKKILMTLWAVWWVFVWKGPRLTWKSLSWGKAGWASLSWERALSRAPLLSIAEICSKCIFSHSRQWYRYGHILDGFSQRVQAAQWYNNSWWITALSTVVLNATSLSSRLFQLQLVTPVKKMLQRPAANTTLYWLLFSSIIV